MLLLRQSACRTSALPRRRRSSHVRRPRAHPPVSESKLRRWSLRVRSGPGGGLISGPDGAMDRRVCLPHAATATFEPTSAPGLGSPRPHPHLKLLHRVFKFRLRRISPETRTAAAPPGGTKALGQAFGCTGAKRHYRSPPKSSHDSWPEKITETKTAIKQLAAPLRSTRRSFLD